MRSNAKQIRNLRHCLLILLMYILFISTQYNVDAQIGIKIGLVADIVYSSDGSKIAIAAGQTICSDESDHVIKIIDAASQTELQSLEGHECPVLSIAWKPDGTELASTGQDNSIRIWDLATGETTLIIDPGVSPDGQFSLEWSPDGSTLVNLFGGIWINAWDASTGEFLFTLKGHTSSVIDVEWSPDGSQLASGSSDYTVRIWDVETRTTTMSLSGHTASVIAIGWSPDGSKIASGSGDDTLRIWDTATGQLLDVIDGPAPIAALSWNPDSNKVGTVDLDSNIQIVHLLAEPIVDTIQTSLGPLLDIEWNPASSNEFIYFGRDSGSQGALFDQLSIPNVNAGPDQTLTDADDDGEELVTLDGSNTNDSDGTIVDYIWTEDDVEIATGVSPQVTLPVGIHTITLTVTDDDGLTAFDTVEITVEEAPLDILSIDTVCSPIPDSKLYWRVNNTNAIAVDFDWELVGTSQEGSGTAPAGTVGNPGVVTWSTPSFLE